jgi:hypothetical protein
VQIRRRGALAATGPADRQAGAPRTPLPAPRTARGRAFVLSPKAHTWGLGESPRCPATPEALSTHAGARGRAAGTSRGSRRRRCAQPGPVLGPGPPVPGCARAVLSLSLVTLAVTLAVMLVASCPPSTRALTSRANRSRPRCTCLPRRSGRRQPLTPPLRVPLLPQRGRATGSRALPTSPLDPHCFPLTALAALRRARGSSISA